MKERIPEVSIIVPVYNAEEYLVQCLESLIGQTMENIEIICVDDGSTDNSLDMLNKYARMDDRIKILQQVNSGVSAARNSGLEIAVGKYYMFVDSDDWLDIDACNEMYTLAERNNADCVMCSYVKEFSNHSVISHIFQQDFFVWNEDEVRKNFHRRLFGPLEGELAHPEYGDILVSPWMQLFKTEKFKSIKFFDIREIGTFEDGLYQIELYEDCRRLVYTDKHFYHYRKTNSASITTAYKEKLYLQWQNLFGLMEAIITEKQFNSDYSAALNNRICLSMIGLGLNQIKSGKGIIANAKELKRILNSKHYRTAFSRLKFEYFPLHWKVFFMLCKVKSTLLLVIMLNCIEFLRRRSR